MIRGSGTSADSPIAGQVLEKRFWQVRAGFEASAVVNQDARLKGLRVKGRLQAIKVTELGAEKILRLRILG